jgi:hypothetical protein
LGLAGCNYDGGDPKVQVGANPELPKLQQYLIPPIQIAKVAIISDGVPIFGFEHDLIRKVCNFSDHTPAQSPAETVS